MNKDKQIEEMRLAISEKQSRGFLEIPPETKGCSNRELAEHLVVNKSYRKQSEGKWEIVKGSNGQEKMVCTNCRHGQDLHSTFTYCPNCGARMHGAKMKGGAE